MFEESFDELVFKLQDELIETIRSGHEVNDYEIIVYKYVFINELKVPLLEDIGIEFKDSSFILYIIPDDLKFSLIRRLDDDFDRFELSFMPNSYNIIKLKFELGE